MRRGVSPKLAPLSTTPAPPAARSSTALKPSAAKKGLLAFILAPWSAATEVGATVRAKMARSLTSVTRMLTTSVVLSGVVDVSATTTVGVHSGWSSQSRLTAPETEMLPETGSTAKGADMASPASSE